MKDSQKLMGKFMRNEFDWKFYGWVSDFDSLMNVIKEYIAVWCTVWSIRREKTCQIELVLPVSDQSVELWIISIRIWIVDFKR